MTLELYYAPSCPFCRKVLDFMDEHGIDIIILKDKSANPEFQEELVRLGGKSQVPCLFIDGEALYESDDIIEWLRQQRRQSPPGAGSGRGIKQRRYPRDRPPADGRCSQEI